MSQINDYSLQLNVVGWTLTGLSGVFLGLRCYCKFLGHRRLWWDDYVLITSWICIFVSTIIVSLQIRFGLGKHLSDIPPQNLAAALGVSNSVSGTFSILSAVWSKTSFALTLLRFVQGYTRGFVWFAIVSMNVFMGLSALFFWIECSPLAKMWNPDVPGTCWDRVATTDYTIFSSAYSGIMDIVLAILPWSVILGLQMELKEKIGVVLAMSMGILAGSTAFIKCTKIPLLAAEDITFNISQLVIWATAETCTTIMAASIPALRVLIRDLRSSVTRYHTSKTPTRTGGFKSTESASLKPSFRKTGASNSGNQVVVTANPSPPGLAWPDNGSDQYILENQGSTGSVTGIVQTNEIRLEYHPREPENEFYRPGDEDYEVDGMA